MNKKLSVFSWVLCLSLLFTATAFCFTQTYEVKQTDIIKGMVVKKVPLTVYALPTVKVTGVVYAPGSKLPADAHTGDAHNIQLSIGMERKQPFLLIQIPAYAAGADAAYQLSSVTIDVQENPNDEKNNAISSTERTMDVTTSVLSTGTWYKIGITKTGFYKIDYNFINSMGINPSTVNPANMRIVGNGGQMLSEDNKVARPADLIENAIWVNAGSDNVFKSGDYAVFYATGTVQWRKDSINQRFVHQKNLYTDTAYYFISFDNGAGLRIGNQTAAGTPNYTSTSFNYYDSHEADLVNPTGYGKEWFGEEFSPIGGNLTQTFNFNTGNTISGNIYCSVNMASTCDAGINFTSFSINGIQGPTSGPALVTSGDYIMDSNIVSAFIPCSSNQVNVAVTFIPADNNTGTVGYLYYIELNGREALSMTADQMNFRDWQTVGSGKIASYTLQNANSFTQVWDVTNPQVPVLMQGTLSGSTYTFSQDAAMLHEFAAMNSSNLFVPAFISKISPQNLHGAPQSDMIIVTVNEFLDAANKLAAYHRSHDNLSVYVATTDQIYNEFSSGKQDISAIRDFARMFYKRGSGSTLPKYLLLFGGASYDYKNRIAGNNNLVPVFESAEFTYDLNSYCTDDFFGFLDDNEYIENPIVPNALDIAVGRLPARNVIDADSMADKIINYSSTATLGPWRIADMFVACRNDGAGQHMLVAESIANVIDTVSHNLYNMTKVYEDAIPVVSTPAGYRCPNANAVIDQQLFKGVFMINYNGHGNTEVWSADRILTSTDFNNWTNRTKLPFMVTATCDFGQFDHPSSPSAAEQLVLEHGAGAIAMLTTTQAVFSQYNQTLNEQYVTAQYTAISSGVFRSFGEAYRAGKNATYGSTISPDILANFRKFALLGDPAVVPDFPQYNINIDSITDGYTLQVADTISALGKYLIFGTVRDSNGNVITGFNGNVWVSFYDKPKTVTPITTSGEPYQIQNSLIYKGIASVNNGHFNMIFITPKDINYSYGKGKISTYATNNITDGAGADMNPVVGGFSKHPVISSIPPVIDAYINDSLFINGGITGSNTSLFLILHDSTGINVSGNVIGHDMVAILDDNSEAPYILNDYYETAPNSYQTGYVKFPVYGLADGKHNFKITAWDVNDNYGIGSVDFVVIDGKIVDIQHLGNYPNPFNNTTNFVFEHNHPLEQADVQINIYNTEGVCVKNINQSITLPDSRTAEITWDGTSNNGGRLPSGLYVYQLVLTTLTGNKSTAYQKLVIVR